MGFVFEFCVVIEDSVLGVCVVCVVGMVVYVYIEDFVCDWDVFEVVGVILFDDMVDLFCFLFFKV